MKNSSDIIYKYQPLWGSWEVEEFVGEGNFGRVYKISREEWDQKYISAVKFISIPQSKNDFKEAQTIGIDAGSMKGYFEDFVKNIVNEIELMYKLKGNSNIVSYEDHMIIKKDDEIGWHILIKMEFVQSLTDYIAKNEVSISDVIRLGIEICKALETCEKLNIIHRDIKDANIFVSKNGNFKLGDFGIAKELSKSGRAASMRGTPLYMAPEVYKGENYDSTVDTYSLGIVMYRLLHKGRLPFMPPYPNNITYNDTENSIENRMRGEIPEPPVDAKDELGEIVLKAFSYNPSDRFKSPKEMRQALEHAIGMIEGNRIGSKLVEVEMKEAAGTKGGLTNKTLDSGIKEKNSYVHSKTVSIFNNELEKNAEEDNETAAIFKNVKKNHNGKYDSTANLHMEKENPIEDINAELIEDTDIINKYVQRSKLNKNRSKNKKIITIIAIMLIVTIGGIAFMMNKGNKALEANRKSTIEKEANLKTKEADINYYEQAKKMYEEGYYDAALDLVTQELNQNPDNTEAIWLQIDTKSKLSDILLKEGMAFLKENKLQEAHDSFEAAVRMFRPNTEAQKQLEKVKERIKTKK